MKVNLNNLGVLALNKKFNEINELKNKLEEENKKYPCVIVIYGSAWRGNAWDDLGCYGNLDVKTPNIDELAKNGIVFKNTFLTTSSCSPSMLVEIKEVK